VFGGFATRGDPPAILRSNAGTNFSRHYERLYHFNSLIAFRTAGDIYINVAHAGDVGITMMRCLINAIRGQNDYRVKFLIHYAGNAVDGVYWPEVLAQHLNQIGHMHRQIQTARQRERIEAVVSWTNDIVSRVTLDMGVVSRIREGLAGTFIGNRSIDIALQLTP
jgi:hypothetical protein